MKYKRGQILKTKENISCLACTIPAGSTIRICCVDVLLRCYDIVDCNNPHLMIDDIPEKELISIAEIENVSQVNDNNKENENGQKCILNKWRKIWRR